MIDRIEYSATTKSPVSELVWTVAYFHEGGRIATGQGHAFVPRTWNVSDRPRDLTEAERRSGRVSDGFLVYRCLLGGSVALEPSAAFDYFERRKKRRRKETGVPVLVGLAARPCDFLCGNRDRFVYVKLKPLFCLCGEGVGEFSLSDGWTRLNIRGLELTSSFVRRFLMLHGYHRTRV